MIAYLLKVLLCSGSMLLFYHLVLAREKMFRFNRFFLLGSLILSLAVPLVPVEIFTEQAYFTPPPSAALLAEQGTQVSYSVSLLPQPTLPSENGLSWMIAAVYIIICGGLMARFGRNLIQMAMRIRSHSIIRQAGAKLILLESLTLPHSFLNYIFLNKAEYLQGTLEPEILAHEHAHVRQWHSLDILFVEILKVIFWFNPAFYLYRRAIALNHEYLADEAAIQTCRDISTYQFLLLQKATSPAPQPFTSTFNYSFTKKRFVMMNKHTSRTRALLTQMAALPLIALAFFAFSDLTLAQIAPPPPPVPAVETEASSDLVKEYNSLINKYIDKSKPTFVIEPNRTDGDRMEYLLTEMTKEQKSSLDYVIERIKPLFKTTPTVEEYEKYKNPALYGVWIDEKKVPNSELNKYKPAEFSQVYVSRLTPKAQKTIGYKYKYQLDLMTNAHYEAHRKRVLESPKRYIILKKGRK